MCQDMGASKRRVIMRREELLAAKSGKETVFRSAQFVFRVCNNRRTILVKLFEFDLLAVRTGEHACESW